MMKHLSTLNGVNTSCWKSKMAAVLLISLALSACSSSGGDNNNGGGNNNNNNNVNNTSAGVDSQFPSAAIDLGPESLIVTGLDSADTAISPWLVSVRLFKLNSKLATTGDASVNLLKYRDNYPVFRHADFYARDLDTCEVNDPDAPPEVTGGGEEDDPLPLVSGGDSVVINTPSGPWATLEQVIEDGELRYVIDNGLPGELLPEGATLSIPGDEFPTVAAHPLFDPTPPERLLPDADIPLTADSAYSWIPGNNKTYMRLAVLAYDDDDDFVDFVVGCDVRDDGSFEMPADVVAFIATTPYRLQLRYSRIYNRLDFVNGVAIRQRSNIAE